MIRDNESEKNNNYSRIVKIVSLVAAALMAGVGIFFIMADGISGPAVILCGIVLMIWGASKLMGYFSKDMYGIAFQHGLVSGVLALLTALFVILGVEKNLSRICFAIAVYIIVEGLLYVQSSVDAKKFGLYMWPLIMLLSVVLVCEGVIVIAFSKMNQSMIGLCLLAEGIVNAWVTGYTVRLRKHKGRFAYWFSDRKEEREDIVGDIADDNE